MQVNRRSVVAGMALAGCAVLASPARALTFAAPDGVPVSGETYGKGEHGVVLVPGGHGVAETWHLQAQRLAGAGFRVLATDYRGLGGTTTAVQDGDKAHLDVLGAIARLQTDGATRISLVGASWGGRAAAMAAMERPAVVDRIVLLAHSPFDTPERLGGRKLFIVGRDDRDGAGQRRLESIQRQFDAVSEPKRLVVLDGAAHAQFLFLTAQAERLYSEIESFLTEP